MMKRVLISQNEKNNGTDYLIVNGNILTDEDSIIKYGRELSETDNWAEIFKDDYLEIRKNKNKLLLKSFYSDKDVVGRAIYYLYLIEDEFDNFDSILEHLERDSQLIVRTVDKQRTQEIIQKIKKDRNLKKKISKFILMVLGTLAIVYFLTRIE